MSEERKRQLQEQGGRMGRKNRSKPGFFQKIGKKGGDATKKLAQEYPNIFSRAGRKGGRIASQKLGPTGRIDRSRKGGESLREKKGSTFFSEIGKKGGKASRKKRSPKKPNNRAKN